MASMQEIFSVARSALNAGQNQAAVASFNIANAQTPGFARRISNLSTGAAPGFGVVVGDPVAVRNALFTRSLIAGNSRLGYHQGQLESLQVAESALNDLTGTGLSGAFSSLTDALAAVATNPSDTAAREALVGSASALAATFNSVSQQLQDAASGTIQTAKDTAARATDTAKRIADINQRIRNTPAGTQQSSTLVDQRNVLLEQLAQDVDIQVVDQADGSVRVFTSGGRPLVSAEGSSTLKVVVPNGDDSDLSVVIVKAGGQEVELIKPAGGELGGVLAAYNEDLKPAVDRLDEIAFRFAEAFNVQHQSGTDSSGVAGGEFFQALTSQDGAAANLAVSEAIVQDPSLIAAAGTGPQGASDNGNIQALAALLTQEGTLTDNSSVIGAYDGLVLDFSLSLSNAQTGVAIEEGAVAQVQALISSESGVNTEEELNNLTQAQFALEAAGDVINRLEAMTNTLLSILG